MDRLKLIDFITDDRLAEIVKAEREGRLEFRKHPPQETCGNCLNYIEYPHKASGVCAKKTATLRYRGQRPEMLKVFRCRPK